MNFLYNPSKTKTLGLYLTPLILTLFTTLSYSAPLEGRWRIHALQCEEETFEVNLLKMLYSGYDYIYDLSLNQENGEIDLTHSKEHCDFKLSYSNDGHVRLETPKELEGISLSPFGVWHAYSNQNRQLKLTPIEDQSLKDFCIQSELKDGSASWIFEEVSS